MTISVSADIGSIVHSIVWLVLIGLLIVKYRTEIKKFVDRYRLAEEVASKLVERKEEAQN